MHQILSWTARSVIVSLEKLNSIVFSHITTVKAQYKTVACYTYNTLFPVKNIISQAGVVDRIIISSLASVPFGYLPAVPFRCVTLAWCVSLSHAVQLWVSVPNSWKTQLTEAQGGKRLKLGWKVSAALIWNFQSWNSLFTGPFLVLIQLSLLRVSSVAVTAWAMWFRATYRSEIGFVYYQGSGTVLI